MNNLQYRQATGPCDYQQLWQMMKEFVAQRTPDTCDELWLLEHQPVYTLGQAGKMDHVLKRNNIPLVRSDRGGQVTYHGPGQLMIYTLFDLKRLGIGIRTMVQRLEQVLIALLQEYGISADVKAGAPGVYVDDKKIASIGLRVKKGYTYHGAALNIDMDLGPFQAINPCGYAGMTMVQLRDFYSATGSAACKERVVALIQEHFCYRICTEQPWETQEHAEQSQL